MFLFLMCIPLLAAPLTMQSSSLPPCTIIGGTGRIGSLLSSASPSNTKVVTSKTPTPYDAASLPAGPIYVSTRNDFLTSVIENTPRDRREDLVFLQNGYIEKFLKTNLSEVEYPKITQGLLYFAVTSLGATPIDGVTAVSPNGLTSVTGKWAGDLKARCDALGLKCSVIDDEQEFRKAMFEKLMWIATLQLVGDAKNEPTVGETQKNHLSLVETVLDEMAAGLKTKNVCCLDPGYKDRLLAYTRVVEMFPPKVKEFPWRNQYFYNLGEDLMPEHNGLLRDVGAVPAKEFPAKERLVKVKLPLPPLGIVFEEIEGGRSGVVVTALTTGGAADVDGQILIGDRLVTTTAVKISPGTSSAALVEIDCRNLDFDTVVSAIGSHQPKFRVDAVEMTFSRAE